MNSKRYSAADIMQKDPCRLNQTDSMHKAYRMMIEMGYRHLPVVDGPHLTGIISINDFDRFQHNDLAEVIVSNAMSSPVRFIAQEDSLDQVVEVFTAERLHAVPVVDQEGRLTGIISSVDLVGFMYERWPKTYV